MADNRKTGNVLGSCVDVTNHKQATERILALAGENNSSYICFATAHMLVEASQDKALKAAYRDADMVNADGTPVAWCLRLLGFRDAECVSGPRLAPILLEEAARLGVPVGFHGGRPETLDKMTARLKQQLPELEITYCYSPPFRQLTPQEDAEVITRIRESGARLLFVCLGSPKQEMWMAKNTSSLPCVLLGVGAVVEFLAGEKYMPPIWIQKLGLTWLIRLCQEPRRLLRRNIVYSPLFVLRFAQQQISSLLKGRTASPAK